MTPNLTGSDWHNEWLETNKTNSHDIEDIYSCSDDDSNHGMSLNFAHQINNTTINTISSKRWLFDTGADINATNDLNNFVKSSLRNLRPREVANRTGSGIIYPEKIGEVCLSVKGLESNARKLRLKMFSMSKTFP